MIDPNIKKPLGPNLVKGHWGGPTRHNLEPLFNMDCDKIGINNEIFVI
jgi:hypothetical protein